MTDLLIQIVIGLAAFGLIGALLCLVDAGLKRLRGEDE